MTFFLCPPQKSLQELTRFVGAFPTSLGAVPHDFQLVAHYTDRAFVSLIFHKVLALRLVLGWRLLTAFCMSNVHVVKLFQLLSLNALVDCLAGGVPVLQ